MSKIKLTNSSGSSSVEISAPNTNSDRTLTLPDATCTLLTTDGDGSSLTSVPGGQTTDNFSTLTVSADKPTVSTNPSATGYVWIDKTRGEMYVCTTSTAGSNVWKNMGDGTGGINDSQYLAATGPDSAAGVTDGDLVKGVKDFGDFFV